jgi:hypothetical protein
VLRVALDRDDVDGVRLVGVYGDGEAEIAGQVTADLLPGVAGVVTAHHVPMLLHEQHVRARRVHGNIVDAVAHLGLRIGQLVLGVQAVGRRTPGLSAAIRVEGAGLRLRWRARCGWILGSSRMVAHATGAWPPEVAFDTPQPGKLLWSAASLVEQGHARLRHRIDRVWSTWRVQGTRPA